MKSIAWKLFGSMIFNKRNLGVCVTLSLVLSVICVVFLWSVSIDKAYLNVLVVISKLLGQSILGMCQLSRMNILVFKKRLVASSKSIIREKVNVIFVTIVNKAFSVWPYYFNNQHPVRLNDRKLRNNYFVKIEHHYLGLHCIYTPLQYLMMI